MDLLLWFLVAFFALLFVAFIAVLVFLCWVFGYGRLDSQNKEPR
jgi:hypothetical protein